MHAIGEKIAAHDSKDIWNTDELCHFNLQPLGLSLAAAPAAGYIKHKTGMAFLDGCNSDDFEKNPFKIIGRSCTPDHSGVSMAMSLESTTALIGRLG